MPTQQTPSTSEPLSLQDLQQMIQEMFGHKDQQRGIDGTYMWFMEEVGELASALRCGKKQELQGEFADVLAWLVTLANLSGIDLTKAVRKKYITGCPRCGENICTCQLSAKP